MTIFNDGIAAVNGEFTLISKARIPITDRGFLFGHSVFETLLVNHGKIILWEKHMERLTQSCAKTFIQLPNLDELKKLSLEAIDKNIKLTSLINHKMALRLIVTSGNSIDLSIPKKEDALPIPNIFILCRNIIGPSKENYNKGLSLKTIYDSRSKELLDVKSCNYLFNIMALEQSRISNFDDALLFNKSSNFTESTTANFIWFDANYTIYSAPIIKNCLPGTTLLILIEALKVSNLNFKWKYLSKNNINLAIGCAILSSTRLIIPIQKIDTHLFNVEKENKFFNQLKSLLEKKLNI